MTKFSGNGGALKHSLFGKHRRSQARAFYSMLEAVENVLGGNQWHAFDCAEAQVVGALVMAGADLSDIVVTEVKSGDEDRVPCRNCRQWLGGGPGAYHVRAALQLPARMPHVAPVGAGGGGVPRQPAPLPRVSLGELGTRMNIFEMLDSGGSMERPNRRGVRKARNIAASLGKRL